MADGGALGGSGVDKLAGLRAECVHIHQNIAVKKSESGFASATSVGFFK
jgi:hypothetical protein